jgi:hypothetical protein
MDKSNKQIVKKIVIILKEVLWRTSIKPILIIYGERVK